MHYDTAKQCCRIVTLALCLLALSACFSIEGVLPATDFNENNSIVSIAVESVTNSNFYTPVAVDIVFVNDNSVLTSLSALNGAEWFVSKQELSKRYDIDVVSIELAPLSHVRKLGLPKNFKRAKNVLLFANYRSKSGQSMAEIGYFKKLKIRLLKDTYQLLELKK